jgi:hypothetical protein
MDNTAATIGDERLFVGVFSTGIGYADRTRERDDDFARLAFLSFRSLDLDVEPDCPDDLAAEIRAHAAGIQAMRGQDYRVSTVGQTVRLGG